MSDSEMDKERHFMLANYYNAFRTAGRELDNGLSVQNTMTENYIKQGIDINYQISDTTDATHYGCTMLHLAIRERHLHSVNVLLNHNAIFTLFNGNRDTALHMAIKYDGHTIRNRENDMNWYKKKNTWQLQGKLQTHTLANAILSAHIARDVQLNPCNREGITHFHIACMVNHVEAMEYFLKLGVPINHALKAKARILPGFTALHFVARYSNLEAANLLLKQGVDVNIKDANGMTALEMLLHRNISIMDCMFFSMRGPCSQLISEVEINESIIKSILFTGNYDAKIGLTVFHVLCTFKDESLAQKLVERDLNVHSVVSSDSKYWPGYTALHFAAHFNVETVKVLLKAGANIKAKDTKGVTPLDLVLQRYIPREIHSILSTQVNLQSIPLLNESANLSDLLEAMQSIAKLNAFLENLADVNARVSGDSPFFPGYTALHIAILLNEKTMNINQLYESTDYKVGAADCEIFTCDNEEDDLYFNRISTCMKFGCSMDVTNAEDFTPVHLAFYLKKRIVVTKFFEAVDSGISTNSVHKNGLSHFHIACATKQYEFAERCLNNGADVNGIVDEFEWYSISNLVRMSANSTPLHIAVKFEDITMTELLLKHKANPYAKDAHGFTPAHLTIQHGSKDIINLLFKSMENLETTSHTDYGLSYVHIAIISNDTKNLKRVLKAINEDVDEKIFFKNDFPKELDFLSRGAGLSTLEIAVRFECSDSIMKCLVERGADLAGIHLPILMYDDILCNTLLNHMSIIEKYSSIDSIDDSGLTLLHLACGKQNIELMKKLLESGADPNKLIMPNPYLRWKGGTPLHTLITCVNLDEFTVQGVRNAIELLAAHGADFTLKNLRGETPLLSFLNEDLSEEDIINDVADLLLQKQKDYSKNPVDYNGMTHFHYACKRNNLAIVEEFIKSGVDINQKTDPFPRPHRGFTPLHYAMLYGSEEIFMLLLQHGANVNARDGFGNTPIQAAINHSATRLDLITAAMNVGADIMSKNNKGQTAFEELLRSSYTLLEQEVRFFLDRGCRINAFNPVSSEGFIAAALQTPQTFELRNQKAVLKPSFQAILKASDVTMVDNEGRNAIHNIVSFHKSRLNYGDPPTSEDYADGIGKLLELGCELDLQNKIGKTALHFAVDFKNYEAIVGLLTYGADININDDHNKTAFYYAMEQCQSLDGEEFKIVSLFTVHIWKIIFAGTHVNDMNLNLYGKFLQKFPINENLKQSCEQEKNKIKNVQLDIFLSDFAGYSAMSSSRLDSLKNWFQPSNEILRTEYPELGGLLRLQYRRAFARQKILKSALSILKSTNLQLPDLCLMEILKFFSNGELQDLINK